VVGAVEGLLAIKPRLCCAADLFGLFGRVLHRPTRCESDKEHQVEHADDSGYQIDEAEVIYWGRCPECLDQADQPEGETP
jgi:hypothetical protein